MFQMIAIDLDGTLLTSQSEISLLNKEVLEEAECLGIKIVIATGRGHFDVKHIIKDIRISPWIIGANGATIHKPDGLPYSTFPIGKERALEILKWLEERDYYYEVFSEQAIYTPVHGRRLIDIELDRLKTANPEQEIEILRQSAVEQFKQSGFEFVTGYEEISNKNKPVFSILAFSFDEDKLQEGRGHFSRYADLNVVHSGYHNIEIEEVQASKGHALSIIADAVNIPLKQVMAIGDSMNDISMLKSAGFSVAMKNAAEEVINVSTAKTETNDADGVAKAIRKYLYEG